MWTFSRAGFFSAVAKGNGAHAEICVRARVLEDFDKLKDLYYPEMGRVHTNQGTDYPYRIYMTRSEWARIMERMAYDVDYKNFKGMVSSERGYAVADLYSDVWAVMYGAEKKVIPERKPIPVDYSDRHAPPFEEWREEKGQEARQRAQQPFKATPAVKLAPVATPKAEPKPTAIEAFNKRYEKAQQKQDEIKKSNKPPVRQAKSIAKAAAILATTKPKRGPNGKFISAK